MKKTSMIGAASLAAMLGGITREFSPRAPHVGEGQKRAAVREKAHRDQQAARVAPALKALAEKRNAWALKRVTRWRRNAEKIDNRAPGHIAAMAGETLR